MDDDVSVAEDEAPTPDSKGEEEDEEEEEPAVDAAADEIMADDDIWAGPGMFELLRFPPAAAAAAAEAVEEGDDDDPVSFAVGGGGGGANRFRDDFLHLEAAAELDPDVDYYGVGVVGGPVAVIEPDVPSPPSHRYHQGSGRGSVLDLLGDDSEEMLPSTTTTGGGGKTSVAQLLSKWDDVFSSEFESEVASMVSSGEDSSSNKNNDKNEVPTDPEDPAVVPHGIAFTCATKNTTTPSAFPKDDVKQEPTNTGPGSHVGGGGGGNGKAAEGRSNSSNNNNNNNSLCVMAQLSLIDFLAFRDRADAIEAAKKFLAAL
jgi:hypothetical protein